tara:strand:+ start:472 stop:693 length:222 start_codon:yes stop_codon:yes gene_type:complete
MTINKMDEKEIRSLFLSGLCHRIPKEYIDEETCKLLFAEFKKSMKGAGCKCKWKSIRQKHLNKFKKYLKKDLD